jgi:hypothetical protein
LYFLNSLLPRYSLIFLPSRILLSHLSYFEHLSHFRHHSSFESFAFLRILLPASYSMDLSLTPYASVLVQVSGIVIEVSPSSIRVCAVLLAGGAFAEEAVANQNEVFPLPPGSDEVAAPGLPVAYGAFAFQHVQSSKFFNCAYCSFGFASDIPQLRRPIITCERAEVRRIIGKLWGNASSTVIFCLQNPSGVVPS